MTRFQWLHQAHARLLEHATLQKQDGRDDFFAPPANSSELRREAQILLEIGLHRDRLTLVREGDVPLTAAQKDAVEQLLLRRLAGEPLAYIRGNQEFYGRDFYVTRDTLIPRPETELLVEEALAFLQNAPAERACAENLETSWEASSEASWDNPNNFLSSVAAKLSAPRILDLGTGTGCLALTLAAEIPHARVVAVDLSPVALAVALENCRCLDDSGTNDSGATPYTGESCAVPCASKNTPLHRRVSFLCADFTAPNFASSLLDSWGFFDIILSNPPYIRSADYARMAASVQDYEPRMALTSPAFAGLEGGAHLAAVILAARKLLRPQGLLLMEHGFDQGAGVRKLLAQDWKSVRTIKDYAGLDRCAFALR